MRVGETSPHCCDLQASLLACTICLLALMLDVLGGRGALNMKLHFETLLHLITSMGGLAHHAMRSRFFASSREASTW